jgi:hypothetical protein
MSRDLTALTKKHDENHAQRLRVIAMWRRSWIRFIPAVSRLIDLAEAQEELLEARWDLIQRLNQ